MYYKIEETTWKKFSDVNTIYRTLAVVAANVWNILLPQNCRFNIDYRVVLASPQNRLVIAILLLKALSWISQ